jgi:hypothetical protein
MDDPVGHATRTDALDAVHGQDLDVSAKDANRHLFPAFQVVERFISHSLGSTQTPAATKVTDPTM